MQPPRLAPLCVLATIIHHTTEFYGTSATKPPVPLSSTATHSKRLHIRYIVVVWSWWHGQFPLPIQKAIAPTLIWRLPNTIQVSDITTDTWDKRRFGLSSLGTCSFLSPISLHRLRVLPEPKYNIRILGVILTIGLPVWTCSQTATLFLFLRS
jgi:hypothetical protein